MKKRIFSLVLVLALVLSMVPAVSAAELSSSVLIPAQYEDARSFSGGYAAVKKDGKWGYIDETGKVVVDFQYVWAGYFSGGVAVVGMLEEYKEQTFCVYHLIDAKGMDVVLENPLGEYYSSNLGYDFYPNCCWYYDGMDTSYDDSHYICYNGVVIVNSVPYTTDGKQITLKESEKSKLYEPTSMWGDYKEAYEVFSAVGAAVDGLIPMLAGYIGQSSTSQYFLMDLEGNIVQSFEHIEWWEGDGLIVRHAPNDGLILASILYEEVGEGWGEWYTRTGLLDQTTGEWVIQPEYTNYWSLFSGRFLVEDRIVLEKDGYYGALDSKGNTVVPFQYTYLTSMNCGFMAAQKSDGTHVYLDEDGREYRIGSINGGIGNIVAASTFGDNGIAAVMDAEGNTYCISSRPVEDVLPAVQNSDQLEPTLFFPDYVEGEPYSGTVYSPTDIVVYAENGLYGFKKLDVELIVNPFSDVKKGQWFYDYVLDMADRGIINGYDDGTFRPNETLRRCEMVQMLYKMAGSPAVSGKASFTDLEAQWYQDAIAWAEENHIVDGMGNGKFDPNGPVTRQQLVTMLYRLSEAEKVNYDLSSGGFADVSDVHAWALDAVKWAVSEGILNGTTLEGKTGLYLAPANEATRAQAAKILSLYD